MKFNNNKTKSKSLLHYFNLVVVLASFSFFQPTSLKAQNSIQSNESNTEELDWNVGTSDLKIKEKELTKEEKEFAIQTELEWQKWEKENAPKISTPTYSVENSTENSTEESETNRVKSPTEILISALVGNWEGFYGGSKAYINFKENKTVVINTSAFSNIPSASGRDHTQLYYEIDASQSPYRLIFYNRDKEIKGVFRIQDNNQITICHNFKNDQQPTEIDTKYTVMTFYKLDTTKKE